MQLHTLHHIHDGGAAINAVCACVCVCVCVYVCVSFTCASLNYDRSWSKKHTERQKMCFQRFVVGQCICIYLYLRVCVCVCVCVFR